MLHRAVITHLLLWKSSDLRVLWRSNPEPPNLNSAKRDSVVSNLGFQVGTWLKILAPQRDASTRNLNEKPRNTQNTRKMECQSSIFHRPKSDVWRPMKFSTISSISWWENGFLTLSIEESGFNSESSLYPSPQKTQKSPKGNEINAISSPWFQSWVISQQHTIPRHNVTLQYTSSAPAVMVALARLYSYMCNSTLYFII